MTNKTYTTILEEAPDGSGDLILTFPQEILDKMGWKEGTILNIAVHEDGKIILTEV